MSVVFGMIVIGIAAVTILWRSGLRSSYVFTACLGGPVLAMFILGLFVPRAHEKHAMCGLMAGMAMALFLMVNHYIHEPPSLRRNVTYTEECVEKFPPNTTIAFRPETIYPYFESLPDVLRVGYLYFGEVTFFTAFGMAVASSYFFKDEKPRDSLPSAFFAGPLRKMRSYSRRSSIERTDSSIDLHPNKRE